VKSLIGLIEFIAVVDHGGFSAAADALGVSTSYVSRRVASLEAHLGIRLLHRTTRRVNLTEIGGQYYEKAVDIIGQFDDLEIEMANQQKLVVGEVKVSAGGIFGEEEVAVALADFALEYPQIKIDLNISNRLVDLSAEGYDLAVRHRSPGDLDLISRKLTSMRMVVCSSSKYFDRYGKPETPEDLRAHNCFQGKGLPWMFQNEAGEYEVKVKGRWSSNSGPALVNAALRGLGVVRLADMYVRNAIDAGRLEVVLEDYEIPPTITYLVYPDREYMPYRLRVLFDFLVERFK